MAPNTNDFSSTHLLSTSLPDSGVDVTANAMSEIDRTSAVLAGYTIHSRAASTYGMSWREFLCDHTSCRSQPIRSRHERIQQLLQSTDDSLQMQ